jgi:hypothetical protein
LCCGEAEPPVGAGEFLHEPEIAKFHEPALIGVEKAIDFRLADWGSVGITALIPAKGN